MEIGVWLDRSTDSINDAVDQTRFVGLADQQHSTVQRVLGWRHTRSSDAGLEITPADSVKVAAAAASANHRCGGDFLEDPSRFSAVVSVASISVTMSSRARWGTVARLRKNR